MNWIKVSEGLPTHEYLSDNVAIWFDDDWFKGYFDNEEKVWYSIHDQPLSGVTHWAYIEPPKS